MARHKIEFKGTTLQQSSNSGERGDRVQMCISSSQCSFAARRQIQAYLNGKYLRVALPFLEFQGFEEKRLGAFIL